MDRFDDLKNINENIENKLKKKPVIKSEKEALSKIDSLNLCEEAINKIIDNMANINNNLNDSIKIKGNEISINLEKFLKKLEEDTNNHIKVIESSNLTEDEKEEEYIKCLDELDKISILSQALENCIEISEKNFCKFFPESVDLNKDNLIDFLIKEEEDLKKTIVYNELKDNQDHLEKLFNQTNIPYLKNYISESSLLTGENIKLKKLIVNENTDIGNVKELLITLNEKNDIRQDQIKKISLKNISSKDLNYIFSQKMKNIKKIIHQPNDKNLFKSQISHEIKNFRIHEFNTENNLMEREDYYINIEYNYPYITCKNCDCSNFKFGCTFPNLIKLKLISCEIPLTFITLEEDAEYFINTTELYLENCGITDEYFDEIYYGILKNEFMRKNLKRLSFKNNKISVISVYNFFMRGEMSIFKLFGLQFLDFSNNNINYFNISLIENVPQIQVFDFSNNNFQLPERIKDLYKIKKKRIEAKETIEEINKKKSGENSEIPQGEKKKLEKTTLIQNDILFLLAGNTVISRGQELEKYCKFLIETFPKIDFPLRSLNFSGLFYGKNFHQYLYKMDLLKYKKSLIEIDLSICSLTDVEVSKLFMKEFLLKNLKKINLSSNNLTDDLFKLLIENNSHEIYNKLKEINLSNNQIYLNRIKEVTMFLKLFDCLERLLLYDTPAEEIINNYIKKKIIRFNEEQNNKKITTEFNKDELIVKDLLENNSKNSGDTFGNQSKIKLYLNNTIDYKFIEASKKLYPELFDKIEIKNAYNYFN